VSDVQTGTVTTKVPARLDRLPWSRWHWMIIIARPGYVPRLGRSMLFLGVLGVGVIASTLLTGLVAYGHTVVVTVALAQVLATLANVGLYLISFRVLTPKGVPTRNLASGAAAGGIAWTALQALAAVVVRHYLHSDSVYGLFATVLVLLAWIYLGHRSPCTPPRSTWCSSGGSGRAA
jgi:hypothetical protein